MHSMANFMNQLQEVVGASYFISGEDQMYAYAVDSTTGTAVYPNAVVVPGSAEEVAAVLKICNAGLIPVTVRGGGTGVCGGTQAGRKGIIISLARLNRIIEINKIDRTVTVEAGVVTGELQKTLLEEGLSFPQNISSAASCFIGGNVAVSSGSPKSLKYGSTKNFVLNLEVALADGTIFWTGRNVSKNATGYNLTQLFTGSEGTLGIITKIVLQLVSPANEVLLMAPFSDINRLFDCVHRIFETGFEASSIEFIDRKGYEITSGFLNHPVATSGTAVDGLLWVEFEYQNETEAITPDVIKAAALIQEFSDCEPMVAQTKSEIGTLWAMRKRTGDAVMSRGAFRDVDIVVPRSAIHKMYAAIVAAAENLGFQYTVLGHAGNGNFHVNILRGAGFSDDAWEQLCQAAAGKIFGAACALGGTLSGEHGIGQMHARHLELAFSQTQLRIMEQVRKIFDPNGIFNSYYSKNNPTIQ